MTSLQDYHPVRICQLVQSLDAYNIWGVNQRPPAIGDYGIIVDRRSALGLPDTYLVKLSDAAGIPIWLDEFFAEELEPLD